MTHSNIEEIAAHNNFVLLDKSAVNFSFERNNAEKYKEKIKYKQGQIETISYWNNVFQNFSENFKFRTTEGGMNEFKDFKKIKYKKSIKNSYCRDHLDYFRLLKKEQTLIRENNSFFEGENILNFSKEKKNLKSLILKKYFPKINVFNESLKKQGKNPLSLVDVDYFSSAILLNLEGYKISLITNDHPLFCFSGSASKENPNLDFSVYFHSSLGVFTKFE